MATHNYTLSELDTAGPHQWILYQKCHAHGYTNPVVTDLGDGTMDVTIDEADDKPTVLSNLEAATVPALSLDKNSLTIAPDGVATGTVTVTDSRGASASGKVVKLKIPPNAYVKVDVEEVTLNGSGQGVFTFGPLDGCLGESSLVFYYDTEEADAQTCILKFGA